jgi:hypothetical protein
MLARNFVDRLRPFQRLQCYLKLELCCVRSSLCHLFDPHMCVFGILACGPVIGVQYSHLVLCCTFAYNQLTWLEKLEGLLMLWLVRLCSAKQLAQMVKGLTPEQSKEIETMIASNRKSQMVEATKFMLSFDSRHRLRDIKCPTLVVAGASDTAVPLYHARMLAEGILDAKLYVIPQAGHEMLWTHIDCTDFRGFSWYTQHALCTIHIDRTDFDEKEDRPL